jgi:uncharacterized protein
MSFRIAFSISIAMTLLGYLVLFAILPALRGGRARTAFGALAILVHLAWWIPSGSPPGLRTAARAVAATWLVAASVVALAGGPLVALVLAVRLARRRPAHRGALPSVDLGRRRLLGLALPAVAVCTGAVGARGAERPFVVRMEELPLAGLPPALDGFRIGHLSDVHIGPFIDLDRLSRAIATLNDAGTHLQVLTGDLVDELSLLDATFATLGQCRARHGLIATLGNHEKTAGLGAVLAAYQRHGDGPTRLLMDDSTRMDHDGHTVCIVGVDYPMHLGGNHMLPRAEQDALMRVSAERAFQDVGREETVICLSHHPDFFPFAAERGALLTLAGHTHGGQVAAFGRPLVVAYDHMHGWYHRGDSHLYVSAGTGHWLPIRIGVPAEVVVITLRRS